MKKGLKGKGFFTDYRKVEGVLGKNAILFLLPSVWNRGGVGASAPVNPGGQGLVGGPGRGERERVGRRFDPRPHLGLGRRSEAGRRGRAATALVARGGGASAREERAGGGGGSCEAAAKLGVPL